MCAVVIAMAVATISDSGLPPGLAPETIGASPRAGATMLTGLFDRLFADKSFHYTQEQREAALDLLLLATGRPR